MTWTHKQHTTNNHRNVQMLQSCVFIGRGFFFQRGDIFLASAARFLFPDERDWKCGLRGGDESAVITVAFLIMFRDWHSWWACNLAGLFDGAGYLWFVTNSNKMVLGCSKSVCRKWGMWKRVLRCLWSRYKNIFVFSFGAHTVCFFLKNKL